jgi:hypothetical protein
LCRRCPARFGSFARCLIARSATTCLRVGAARRASHTGAPRIALGFRYSVPMLPEPSVDCSEIGFEPFPCRSTRPVESQPRALNASSFLTPLGLAPFNSLGSRPYALTLKLDERSVFLRMEPKAWHRSSRLPVCVTPPPLAFLQSRLRKLGPRHRTNLHFQFAGIAARLDTTANDHVQQLAVVRVLSAAPCRVVSFTILLTLKCRPVGGPMKWWLVQKVGPC